jgi:ribosome maturation factor RimP
MADVDTIVGAVAPVVDALGLRLYDVEVSGGPRATVRVTVDRPGGVDLEAIAAASEAVSRALDADPALPVAGRGSYTLEVTSPGLERRLRTPDHFRGAVGSPVSIKTTREHGGDRRRGTLVAADDDGIDVDFDTGREHLAYPVVAQARTVFEWGPAPKPGARAREVAKR